MVTAVSSAHISNRAEIEQLQPFRFLDRAFEEVSTNDGGKIEQSSRRTGDRYAVL
jgi:hypothetical protein